MSLQSRQIPHDIVRAILDHLDHLPSLAAVSLTSRNYTAFAQRRLYHSVVLTATDNLKDTQISILLGFVKFLDGVPRICTYIHVLYIHSPRLPSFPIPVTQLHSVIRKLPALHTLTLKLIELRTGSELMCTKLDTALTTIRLMDVYANRHVIPSLIHPLPQLYILDICGSILDVTLGEEQAASITIPHSPQCLKVKSGLGYTFLTDVGVTSSFSVDFIDITSPTDIHRISHFLSHRCRSLQHLFLNLCYFTASDGTQIPTLARPWPKLQRLDLAFMLRVSAHRKSGKFRWPARRIAEQFSMVLNLLESANPTTLSTVVLGLHLIVHSNDSRGSLRPGVRLDFEGDWHRVAHVLDKFPNLTSVKMLKVEMTPSTSSVSDREFISDLDRSAPLDTVYQTELAKILPSLNERGLLHFN